MQTKQKSPIQHNIKSANLLINQPERLFSNKGYYLHIY